MAEDPVRTFLILERDIFKCDVTLNIAQNLSAFPVLDVRFDADHLNESLESGVTVLELLGKINDHPDRFGEDIYIEQKCNEIRYFDQTFDHKHAACNDNDYVDKERESSHA